MISVFLDASVIFSAIYSPTGASREILRHALGGTAQVVVSSFVLFVLEEATRNLAEKAPTQVDALRAFIDLLDPLIVPQPTQAEVNRAAAYCDPEDAPVIAAAINAKPDYLATLDRKHLINPPQVSARSGLQIALPETVLHAIRRDLLEG